MGRLASHIDLKEPYSQMGSYYGMTCFMKTRSQTRIGHYSPRLIDGRCGI